MNLQHKRALLIKALLFTLTACGTQNNLQLANKKTPFAVATEIPKITTTPIVPPLPTETVTITPPISVTITPVITITPVATATLEPYGTTYYIRTDGGTITQCNGKADAPYSGSGTNQPCAVSHPFWILPPGGTPVMQGGDTLIIGSGEYMIGYGAPNSNSQECASAWAYSCTLTAPPAGPDSNHKTRIYGKGWNTGCNTKPQLWGTERVWQVLALNSNTDVQCLEITDHSACIESGPVDGNTGAFPTRCQRDSYPFGTWASTGVVINDHSNNVNLKNLDIHGLANTGLAAFHVGDVSLEQVNIIANGWVGWNGDMASTSDDSYTGTINLSHVKIEWNGCGEKYPLTVADLSSSTDKHHCWEQQQGGYGDGIGLGDGSPGTWNIYDSSISWNTSDGVDLLHGNGDSTITFIRSKAEGNNGNQFKSSGTAYIENSLIIGNCGFFHLQPFTSTKDNTGAAAEMNYCRAAGNSFSFTINKPANKVYVSNSTILGNGDVLTLLVGSGCQTGLKHLILRNNIFYGGDDWRYNYSMNPDRELAAFSWTEGSCTNAHFDEDYNLIYNTKANNSGCVGAHSKCGVDPLFTGTIKQGPLGNYYTGTNYAAQLHLQPSSPAVGAANTAIFMIGNSNDYYNTLRGSIWNLGGIK